MKTNWNVSVLLQEAGGDDEAPSVRGSPRANTPAIMV